MAKKKIPLKDREEITELTKGKRALEVAKLKDEGKVELRLNDKYNTILMVDKKDCNAKYRQKKITEFENCRKTLMID